MTDVRVLLCTAPPGEAEAVARALLETRLVACVNIVPGVRSLYRWEGRIADDAEALLVMKTTESHVAAVIEAVHNVHPYDVPEVLALAVDAGSPPYLDWVRRSI